MTLYQKNEWLRVLVSLDFQTYSNRLIFKIVIEVYDDVVFFMVQNLIINFS